MAALAARSGVSKVELHGIAGFYPRLRSRPSGVHTVAVCTGTACHVKGAGALHDAFRSWLKIPEGSDTDPEGLFTVNTVACLGCCMIAPAVQIDQIIYGTLSPQDVPSVLADFLETKEAAHEGLARSGPAAGGASTGRRAPPASPRRAGEVRICLCSSCSAAGSRRVWEAFRAFDRDFILKSVGCTGVSYEAPSVEVVSASGASYRYGRILPQQARLIVERHFQAQGLARRLSEIPHGLAHRLLSEPALRAVTRHLIPETGESADAYWTMQKRIVTEGFGSLHPLDIDEYERSGGLSGLRRARAMTPE
jgi:NADH-quinone oxidoreductase subunit F